MRHPGRLALGSLLVLTAGCSLVDSHPDSVSQAIGSVPAAPADPTARLGIYDWGGNPTGYSFADMLNGPAGLISQVGARTIRVALSDPDAYTSTSFASLSATAQSQPFATLFGSASFDTYLLTTYSQADNPSNGCLPLWYDGYPQAAGQLETAEIQDLAEYLGQAYPSKKFILLNWEGDSAIGSLSHYCNEALTPTMWQGYIDWINARADGVLAARADGVSNVFSGLEFNAVQRLTGSDDYYGNNCSAPDATSLTAGCSWCDADHPCVISTVAPYVNVDYLSYSSWQSDGVGTATSCADAAGASVSCSTPSACTACSTNNGAAVTCPASCGGSTDPAPEDAEVAARLRYDLGLAQALVPGATPANFLIGEFGIDRNDWGEARAANRMSYVVKGFSDFGASYGVYWQILDNAAGGAFGAFKPDGTEGLVGDAFHAYYTLPTLGGEWDDLVNVADTAHPGAYISIYGENFEPVDNAVSVGGTALTVTYNSVTQINAVLPSSVPAGAQTLTVTKLTSGQTASTTIQVAACAFNAPTTIAAGGNWNISVAGSPGATFYWNGSHNGVQDAVNVPGGTTPYTASVGPFTNSGDQYTRYAVIRDSAGNPICTTNTVQVVVE